LHFLALATDYDGTLATSGSVDAPTLEALEAVKASGRTLLLVTGRILPELRNVFPQIAIFDLVVAENGALLFDPATGEETLLAEPPSAVFVRRLQDLGVAPIAVGQSIVATREPNEAAALTAIRELGLELQIAFNKGAVMVLPSNVNKATGLKAALSRLGLSPHNVVGIGDAENDHAFLIACGWAVAVENAIPALKAKVDWITKAPRSAGVVELANLLLESDLPRDTSLAASASRSQNKEIVQHRYSTVAEAD
jgi:HAD superfamily hydrolase (TIGR01484 family)